MSESNSAGARPRRRRLAASIFGVMLLAVLPASAIAVTRPTDNSAAVADRAARVFYDSRSADRGSVRDLQRASRAAGSAVRSARAAELRRLGTGGKLQLDSLTGTPRSYQDLDGALSGSTGGSPASVALGFARSHAAVLGLSGADLDALGTPKVVTSPSGISSVRFTQTYKGIPAYDNDLRINLDRVNRVLSVTGSPVPGLSVESVTPKLSASQALSALMTHVGVRRDVSVVSSGSDARRTTRFSTDDRAQLVLFHAADGTRLAWHLTYDASSQAWYDAIVDASTGDVLRRTNMVKGVDASVFENYPGDANGGTQQTVTLSPAYVSTGAPFLAGQYARTWNDINSNNVADGGPGGPEEVTPGPPGPYTFDEFTAAEAPNGFCIDGVKSCGWNPDTAGSWMTNKNQSAVQAHYYVSKFHDHLLAAPIGFDADDGNFEGVPTGPPPSGDRVNVNVNEGAASGPNSSFVNIANMAVPPEGTSPRMTLSVFKVRGMGIYRAVNAADDARTVYHEYTHGLSNRLVTSGGSGALNSVQGAALGEAWSDWYAMDYLEAQGRENDTAASGELDMGEYLDGTPHIARFSPLDCPPNGGGSPCDGGVDTGGAGGFTYADFGHICCTAGDIRPEVHSDGEIWAQALWDLRASLGSANAQRLITDGMRLTPPEPSFLDARNAILAADAAAPSNGANRDAIWQVFAGRGMGFYASAESGSDANPVADFSTPPPAGTPKGAIAGRMTDIDTGLPVPGVLVGIAGHMTDPTFPDYLAATTGADGRYAISDVPDGSYPLVTVPPANGYDATRFANVAITPGSTTTRDAELRRDWGASRGGALLDGNDDALSVVDCGEVNLIDQSLASGTLSYSPSAAPPGFPANPHVGDDPYIVVELPKAITVDSFAVDPGDTCGGDPTTVTKDYTIETSPDGVTFGPAKQGAFAPADAHRLNLLTPTANSTNVKFVKITSHSAQNEDPAALGHHIYALAELEVYGTTPNVLPSGTLSTSPAPVTTGQVLTLTADFTDPDSAITGYDWDFDGNGTVDQTTAGPTTTTSYATAGNRVATVAAKDFRGGSGSASTFVAATSPPPGATPLPILTLRSAGINAKTVFTVRCFSACRVTAKVTIDRKTAKRLGLRLRTVSTGIRTIQPSKTTSVTIRLTSKVKRAMRRHRVKRLTGTLRVTATYSDGRRTVASRKVSVRR
jgi:extracellular elastinolytic metalloproteinase